MRTLSAFCSAVIAAAAVLVSSPALAQAHPPGGQSATPSDSASRSAPEGFRAQAQSWPTPAQGWVLGVATCGDGACTSVAHTHDAGSHWTTAGTLPAPIAPNRGHGVRQLQMSALGVGFAFAPDLYATRDGGHSWQQAKLPGDGKQVLALTVSGGVAQLVVSPCAVGTPPYECDQPSSLWRAPTPPMAVGKDPHWTEADVALPATYGMNLDAEGHTAYLTVHRQYPQQDLLYASTDGRHWSTRPVPCDKAGSNATLNDVAAMSARDVGLLCEGDVGFSKSTKRLYRSEDTARSTEFAGEAPRHGIASELAASRTGSLLVATTAAGSLL